MSILAAGLALFVFVHIFTVTPALRGLLARPGKENIYRGGFAIMVLTALGLVIYGKSIASFEPVWEPPVWGRHMAWLLVFISFLLFSTAHGPSVVRKYLRHPMLIGVLIWACAHLLANGDLASMLLFGTFAVFSVLMIVLTNLRGTRKPVPEGKLSVTLMQAAAGAVLYFAVLFAHPYLFGVPAVL